METQSFYFAKGRLNTPKIEVSENWESFKNPLPYEFEMNVSFKNKEDLPKGGTDISVGRLSVTELENGYLFAPQKMELELTITGEQKGERVSTFSDREYKNFYCFGENASDTLGNIHTAVEAGLTLHGGSIIHASCVVHCGRAILFCAPSQTGKSTQAKLWIERFGAHMISSDAPAVFPEGLSASAFGMPWDGSDQITTQESAPIAAIVELRQAKSNSVRQLSKSQAFHLLMKQGHLPMWDHHAMFQEMMVLKKLSHSVPYYRLNCRPDTEAAELLHRIVYEQKEEELRKEEKEMRIKEGYVLRTVMDESIVMPVGENMNIFEGAIVLSPTAAFAWEKLQNNISKSELITAILDEFDVDTGTVENELTHLLEKLDGFGVLENLEIW